MFAITLKVILAFVLTAIPFAFHLWVKPRQASSTKWGTYTPCFLLFMKG